MDFWHFGSKSIKIFQKSPQKIKIPLKSFKNFSKIKAKMQFGVNFSKLRSPQKCLYKPPNFWDCQLRNYLESVLRQILRILGPKNGDAVACKHPIWSPKRSNCYQSSRVYTQGLGDPAPAQKKIWDWARGGRGLSEKSFEKLLCCQFGVLLNEPA